MFTDLLTRRSTHMSRHKRHGCRHTHLGDWVFGRYTLRSFGEPTEDISGGGVAAMEYIEDNHVVILGHQAGYIEIWYRSAH